MRGRLVAGVLAWSVIIAASACKGAPTLPSLKIVQYRITASGCVTIDSVKYDNGHGVITTVAPAPPDWVETMAVNGAGTVEGRLWGHSCGPASVKLKITWTISGYSSESDSSTATLVAPGGFTLSVPFQRI